MKVSKKGKVSADLHVTADPFVLHRVVNDALHQAEVPVMAFSPKYLKQTLGKARRRAVADGQSWAWRLAHDDSPVNIEGASFTADGWLLLGLRVPVSRAGFGDRQAPVEIRDLHLSGGMLHALVGNLDSAAGNSILLSEHPEAGVAESAHVVTKYPGGTKRHYGSAGPP